MKISKMIYEVENVLEVLESGYSTIQWKNKKMVDVLRYEEAKKLRNKIDEAFYTDDVEYDVDKDEIEYVENLLSELDMKIREYENKIERDENYFEYKNNFLSELNMDMNIKIY